MSLVKFAAFEVLSASVARQGGTLVKDAHRHEFDYEPRPGFLYVRSRAISSRTNDNYDNFPAEEIEKAYASFVGKPVFVNHNNENHRRARGVIVDAALHKDANPDGSPDTWVEVLMEVDATNFPKLAQAIMAGEIDRTSMGTDVAYSLCSVCGNKAETPLDYCKHIPAMKGMKFRRKTASGEMEEVLCYEKCYGLSFFENSLLVEEPADPTAYFLGVDDRGVKAKVASRKQAVEMNPEEYAERWEGRDGELRYDIWITQSQSMNTYRFRLSCDDHGLMADKGNYGSLASAQEAADRMVDGHERTQHGNTASHKQSDKILWNQVWHEACGQWHSAPGTCPVTGAIVYFHNGETTLAEVAQPVAASKTASINCDVCGKPAVYGVDVIHPDASRDVLNLCEEHENSYPVAEDDRAILWMAAGKRIRPRAIKLAYGETKVPSEVDTLRDENCPVCGESDSYNGDRCLVCNYVKPPDDFLDPDLEKAKQIDLRQEDEEDEDGETDTLQCDNCENTFAGKAVAAQTSKTSAKPEKGKNPFADSDEEDDEEEDEEDPSVETDEEDTDSNAESEDDETFQAGDTCPVCGKGTLQPIDSEESDEGEDDEADPDEAEAKDGEEGSDEDESDDESDESDDDLPPWLDKSKKSRREREGDDPMRPALKALAEQQRTINKQAAQIAALREGLNLIARAAGIETHPRVAAILKAAADENPGSPAGWASPTEETSREAPAATTEDTLGEVDRNAPGGGNLPDDPEEPGDTSESDVSPDAQTSVDSTETVLDEPLDLNEQDPTAPVEGTDDLGEGPRGQAGSGRTETEVRIGDPNASDVAFSETGWTEAAKNDQPREVDEGRPIAALRLARLRIQAGVEQTDDDIGLSATIAQSDVTDEAIQSEIDTLSKVVQARKAQASQERPDRRLVPRSAGSKRSAPSLRSDQPPLQPVTAGAISDDEMAFE